MNEKNSLGLNICFKDEKDPIKLFSEWFEEAKKSEINVPNAFALGTAGKNGFPTVRIILLKDFNKDGFVFYTNLKSSKHGIESKAAHLSGATKAEEKYEKRKSLDKKRRLGCQSKLLGNVVIDIPPESQLHQQIVRKDFEANVFHHQITRHRDGQR